MKINIKTILKFPSLIHSKLITGEEKITNPVTNAIIMEALDIEQWGEPGQILLTSYFAFENSNPQKIDVFFEQAKKIGIAGFIFKTDRLVNKIPKDFISRCQNFNFPLIQIPGDVTYPKIVNEILSAISNKNSFLLKTYYDNHQKFIHLMMKQADFTEILNTLKALIDLPVTLNEKMNHKNNGTNNEFNTFKIIREIPFTNETNVKYKKYIVNYEDSSKTSTLLSCHIPNLGYEDYNLFIHKVDSTLTDLQFMAIENAVVAIQTELVKRYALRQNNFSHLNEMASALVFGHLTDKDEISDTLLNLKLDNSKKHRIIIINFDHSLSDQSSPTKERYTETIANYFKIYFHDIVYIKQPREFILIFPINHYNIDSIKNKLLDMLDEVTLKTKFPQFISQINISNEVSAYDLFTGYKQAKNTQKFNNLFDGNSSIINTYDELGILKLFIETDQTETIKKFVPDIIWDLQEKNPELIKTLEVFINVNQSYSKTAKILFIHPKTVRYRVNQLTDHYGINFDNPDEILQYNIAIRMIKILQSKEQ